MTDQKGLGQRSDAELESLFGNMYAGWARGVNVTQERFGDGETRFTETAMTPLELAARYVAAEIGSNIYEIANRAAFAPITVFSQIQARIGPVFEEAAIALEAKAKEIEALQRALFFWMPGVDTRLDEPTRELASEDALLLAGYDGTVDGPCWGDAVLARAETAERALVAEQNNVYRSFDKWSATLGWGLSGHQPECWALMDSAVDEFVTTRRDLDKARAALKLSQTALTLAAARFNLMGGVGLVNGADPRVGYRDAMAAATAARAVTGED